MRKQNMINLITPYCFWLRSKYYLRIINYVPV